MKSFDCLLMMILAFGLNSGCRPEYPKRSTAQLTLRLVDDNGQPVPQAKVAVVGFHVAAEGKTDNSGCFLATLRTVSGEVDLEADKEGFYSINRHTYLFVGETNGQYYPWNPLVELQLHKISKPVPMFVKKVDQRDIPAVNRAVGYDLLVGDWIEPFGTGKTADFIIEVLKRALIISNDFMRLRLTFSNPKDGLVLKRLYWRDDYDLRLAATAPDSGYLAPWEFQACDGQHIANPGWNVLKNGDQDANFYFRIRTKTNSSGAVESAMYGKMYEAIQFGTATYPERMPIHFLYYLNPDGTRNTEFSGSNLCAHPGDVPKGH
jgi:hypothetical protein